MKKRRLKIGIFLDNYYPTIDGVVLVVDNLAKMLSKENDVIVVVPNTSTKSEDYLKPYKVYRINSIIVPFTNYKVGRIRPRLSKDFRNLINEKFDIIHIHSPFTIGSLGLKIADKMNIPCIATMHTRFDFEIKKIFKSNYITKSIIKRIIKVYNKCDRCIAINNAMIKVFKDFGYKYEPIVIYNGTDLLPLKEKDKSIKMVNKLFDLDEKDIVFLFVGRLTDIKNIFFILDSLKLLKEDGIKFKMLYVGYGPDENKLKSKIKEYKMEEEVKVLGKITQRELLSSIYARSDLFLFPSLFDASSLVQIESAVNETPGLFIEGSVTSDTVINNISGFTSKNDVVEYKNRIKEILNNKKLLMKVSKNARLMLGKNWKEIADETYDLYINEINNKQDK